MSDEGSPQHYEDNTTGDPAQDTYAHSADQSMGYLETEQLGQTETFGETPHGAYEHDGAMNADADRYTPSSSPDQTRLPDESGQPGAGPWATLPPGSQPLGADEQAMPAESAAWNPPAVSGSGVSATAEQPTSDQIRERQAEATEGKRRTPARKGGMMPITNTDQTNTDQQNATTGPTSEEANHTSGTPVETGKRGRTRKSTVRNEASSQGSSESGAQAEQPPKLRSSARTTKPSTSQEQPKALAPTARGDGRATGQRRAQPERTQLAPGGGDGATGEALPSEEPDMQPSGQPIGVQMPTSSNAGALNDARTRVDNAIDQFASQIPYGEQFAAEAKRSANQALDRLKAQAAKRAAGVGRDLGAQPCQEPTTTA